MKRTLSILLSTVCFTGFTQDTRGIKKVGNEPFFFVDSIRVDREEMLKYDPNDIALVSVYKDSNAIKLVGPEGKDGVVYIETKVFARNRYRKYFAGKSRPYAAIIEKEKTDSSIQYIVNGKALTSNYEADLTSIADKDFMALEVISKEKLKTDYHITSKEYGVIITKIASEKAVEKKKN